MILDILNNRFDKNGILILNDDDIDILRSILKSSKSDSRLKTFLEENGVELLLVEDPSKIQEEVLEKGTARIDPSTGNPVDIDANQRKLVILTQMKEDVSLNNVPDDSRLIRHIRYSLDTDPNMIQAASHREH